MKKFSRICILFVMAIFAVCIMPFNAFADDDEGSGDENILTNSTFESETFEGWSAFGGRSKVNLNKEKSHSGNVCLSTGEREVAWSGPTMNIMDFLRKSSELKFQLYVISEAPEGATVQITVKTLDSNGNDDYVSVASADVTNSEWTFLEGTFSPAGDVSDANVYIETKNTQTDFCIDDVKIIGIQASYESDNNGEKYDFSFESGMEGWVPRGVMSMSVSDKFSYSGSKSLYSGDRLEFWNGPTVRINYVTPGVDYEYSAYVMYNGKDYEESHVFQLRLQYILNGVENYGKIASKPVQKGTWSNLSGHFTLPEGASDIFLYVQTEDVSDEDVTENDLLSFYIDNVTIRNGEKAKKSVAKKIVLICVCIIAAGLIVFAAVIILRRTKNRKSALRSASLDSMTNTYNRNKFEEKMSSLESSPEKAKKVYISVCDVNFLKYLNDNYGHETGDKAIIRCAAVLVKAVGKKGNVYRTGGDEFVCISDIDMTEAIKNELAAEVAKYKGYPFAVAVGTASYDKEIDGNSPDIKAISKRADKEMYKNKQEIKKNTNFNKEL